MTVPSDPDPPEASPVNVLAQLLGDRLDEVVERMISEIRGRVDAYAGLPPDVGLDQSQVVHRLARGIVRSWLERRPLSPDDRRLAREAGARRARQGIPLEAMRSGVLVGRSVAWEYVMALAGELTPSKQVMTAIDELGGDFFQRIDEMLFAMTDGHHEADAIASMPASQTVVQLLQGTFGDADLAPGMARALGLDLTHPRALILLVSLDDPAPASLWEVAKQIAVRLQGILVRVPATIPHLTLIVPVEEAGWPALLRSIAQTDSSSRIVIVGRRPAIEVTHLHDAYRELSDLLLIVRTLVSPGAAVDSQDLESYRLLSRLPEALRDAYIESVFGRVLRLEGWRAEALLATAAALSQCQGNVQQAARLLGCHRKTVYERSALLDELVGPRSGEGGGRFNVGVLLLRLSRHGHLLTPSPRSGSHTRRRARR